MYISKAVFNFQGLRQDSDSAKHMSDLFDCKINPRRQDDIHLTHSQGHSVYNACPSLVHSFFVGESPYNNGQDK